MQVSMMGLERRGQEQEEAGGLETVHLVRRGSDVMPRHRLWGHWKAHNVKDIRQQ